MWILGKQIVGMGGGWQMAEDRVQLRASVTAVWNLQLLLSWG
jgi:hypothetical protein